EVRVVGPPGVELARRVPDPQQPGRRLAQPVLRGGVRPDRPERHLPARRPVGLQPGGDQPDRRGRALARPYWQPDRAPGRPGTALHAGRALQVLILAGERRFGAGAAARAAAPCTGADRRAGRPCRFRRGRRAGGGMARYELLDNDAHRDLRVALGHGPQFGDAVGAVPAFPTEFAELLRDYPILLKRNADDFGWEAFALLGFDRDENLLLQDGCWEAAYLPGCVAKGPFLIGFQPRVEHGREILEPVVHVDLD